MPTLATIRTVSVAIALGLAVPPAVAAREPTLSDIAGCNEQAAARTSASPSPHPGARPETARQDASGPPRADVTPGVVPGSGDRAVGQAPRARAAAPAPGTGGPGEKTDPSGSIITETPDPLVKGMDASKADDARYRAAYRDCMRPRVGGR